MISIVSLRFLAMGPTPFCRTDLRKSLNISTAEAYPGNALALTESIFRAGKTMEPCARSSIPMLGAVRFGRP